MSIFQSLIRKKNYNQISFLCYKEDRKDKIQEFHFLQEKYLSEHNYDEPIDVDSTLKLLNFGDDYSKFIDSLSDEISDLDQNTVKPQRIKRKVRRSTVNIIDFLIQEPSLFCQIIKPYNFFGSYIARIIISISRKK